MEKNYGTTSTTTNNFKKRSYSLGVYALGTHQSSFINAYKKDMKITLRELEILLEEEIEDNDKPTITEKKQTKKVFIVHGRDDGKKYELSCFLYELRFNAYNFA